MRGRRWFADELLREEEVVELPGLVDVDLDDAARLGQAQPAALLALRHQALLHVQVQLGVNPREKEGELVEMECMHI